MQYRFAGRLCLLGAAIAVAALLLASAEVQADQLKATALGEIKSASDSENLPVSPLRESTMLSETKPAGFTAKVELAEPRFGTVEVGGKKIHFVVGARSKEAVGPDVVRIDLDADGRLSDAESVRLTPEKNEDRGTVTAKMDDLRLHLGGNDLPFTFSYMSMPGRGIYATLAFDQYLEAKVTLGGEAFRVAVIDADSNGTFNGTGDLWTIVPAAQPVKRPESLYALSALSEGRIVGDKRFELAVKPDNSVVVIAEPGSEPTAEDIASHRERVEQIWFKRFDGERDGFIQARGVDTSRPTADEPIRWQYVSFDQGLEMAKQQGKPIFVDVLAFWCVWCYRMDYYTYPDAEVVKLLQDSFIPVKVIQEQDPAGDSKRLKEQLGARGIPAMGVWTPDGKLMKYISGWRKPSEFVADLRAALDQISNEN